MPYTVEEDRQHRAPKTSVELGSRFKSMERSLLLRVVISGETCHVVL